MLNKEEIKRRRLKLKMSFMDAARAAGWSNDQRARWYQIETGRRPEITVTTLIAMARALQCTPNDLLVFSR